jgi:hypothetical protein
MSVVTDGIAESEAGATVADSSDWWGRATDSLWGQSVGLLVTTRFHSPVAQQSTRAIFRAVNGSTSSAPGKHSPRNGGFFSISNKKLSRSKPFYKNRGVD